MFVVDNIDDDGAIAVVAMFAVIVVGVGAVAIAVAADVAVLGFCSWFISCCVCVVVLHGMCNYHMFFVFPDHVICFAHVHSLTHARMRARMLTQYSNMCFNNNLILLGHNPWT